MTGENPAPKNDVPDNGLASSGVETSTGTILITLAYYTYRKVSNIRRTLVGNEIVDHSDVIGASPVGAAPTTSSFST